MDVWRDVGMQGLVQREFLGLIGTHVRYIEGY